MLNTLAGVLILVSRSPELALLAKATLILGACLAITRAASRARASARHVILATSFASLMALPLLIAAIPAIAIEVPAPARAASGAPVRVTDPPPGTSMTGKVSASAPARALPGLSLVQSARIAWLAGAFVFLIPVALVPWRLSMIRRTGIPVAWHRDELARLAAARGVSRPVELLEHEAVPGPMTFGVSRPVIVLPVDAREWSDAELRRALMHEIEHIQRGDWLMQIVARIVAALYWFHPLVWSAWRRLCLEAERSCDDAVVMSEERADYAEQLVALAQRMAAAPAQPMLGMANRSDLSTRVTAVLDDRLRRGRAGLTLALGATAVAAVLVLSVAPVRAIAVLPSETESTEAASRTGQAPDERILLTKVKRATERHKIRGLDRALYEAAESGDLDDVKELLAAGANASAIIEGDGSPLIGAARSGRIDIARLLLDHGADPNGVVEGDGSPMIAAAQNGRLDQIQLLIDRGADVNLAVEGDENPLMNAAEGGHLAIVQLLVSKGADIHTRIWNERYDGHGEWRTAVSQARKNGHAEVVKYLESLGARE